jgi:hypothetical protein
MACHLDSTLNQAWSSFYVQCPVREAPYDSEEACPVSQEKYSGSEEMHLRVTGFPSCSHTFGYICLRQWFDVNTFGATTCPTCAHSK